MITLFFTIVIYCFFGLKNLERIYSTTLDFKPKGLEILFLVFLWPLSNIAESIFAVISISKTNGFL